MVLRQDRIEARPPWPDGSAVNYGQMETTDIVLQHIRKTEVIHESRS